VTRSLLTLAVALGLAALGVWLARSLQLDTGLEALLPADSTSVLSIKETREKLALDEPLTVLVDSKDVERNKELTTELGRVFSEWPETSWVMTSYGLDELAERALYYVGWRDAQ
jgi:predicted RND superfamily exporter protein